jgi:gas vesicle protein
MTDERDDDMVDELEDDPDAGGSSGRTGFFTGLVVGALLGAGVALLLAPQRGRVTRKHLGKTVRKLADDTREHVEGWAHDAKKEVRRRRRRLQRRLRD